MMYWILNCRYLFAAGRTGQVPRLFSMIHVRYMTPIAAMILLVSTEHGGGGARLSLNHARMCVSKRERNGFFFRLQVNEMNDKSHSKWV